MALLRRRIAIPSFVPSEKPIFTQPEQDIGIKKLLEQVEAEDTIKRLERLQKIATRPLSLLTTDQCNDLDSVRKLSLSAYGTPAYPVLHNEVTKLFIPGVTYQPHTVGSFFVGCMTPTNLADVAPDVNPGCSLMCSADSLPPSSGKWGFCSQNVLWCVLSSSAVAKNASMAFGRPGSFVEMDLRSGAGELFDFIYMTHIPSSSRAVLFVDYQSYDSFPGFTRFEKARLIHRMKITDIKLLSYDRDPGRADLVYKDLIGSPIKVYKIKPRADPRDNETPEQRAARRAKISKQSVGGTTLHPAWASEIMPMDWQSATTLAVALLMLVILGICASFAVSSLRSKWRT